MIEVFRYQRPDGDEPLTDWLQSLRDKQAQAKVRVRIKRLEAGNFGDCDLAVRWLEEIAACGYQNCQGVLRRLETEAKMSKKVKAAVSHREREVAELRADRGLAVE